MNERERQLLNNLNEPSNAPQGIPINIDDEYNKQQFELVNLGEYQGGMNPQGEREGNGKCTWNDGSYYEGQWQNGKRNGTGIYS